MKKTETIQNKPTHDQLKRSDTTTLQEQVHAYEKEKNILLTLSNDITKVREKTDLIKILSSTLKNFFYFIHPVISLVDQKKKIYFPFLMDAQTHPIKDKAVFNSVLTMQYPFTHPAFIKLLDMDSPTIYRLEEIMDKPGIPSFVRLNYDYGMREAMIMPLKQNMETFGFVFIYSDLTNSFTDEFKSVLQGIAPQLSNAVINIIANDEIRHKEYVNEILLSLSNDMVTVRDKKTLLNVINFGLRKLIYFTHSVMTVLNETGKTYHAFLTDPDSRARKFPEYAEMISIANPIQDGIYDVASRSEKPVVIDMTSINLDKAPLWFKINVEAGVKEMMIKILPGGETRRHSIILFSDRLNNFDEKCINIIERISSQLSTAASNISANEEIFNKEKDKSFLLDFSHDVAHARTKSELSTSIHASLKKLSEVKAYFIRTINEDGETMSPFLYNEEVFYQKDSAFKILLDTKIPINKGVTGKVMKGNNPVLIDFVEEIKNGTKDHYTEFWNQLGARKDEFQKMIGTPLRVGDQSLGILWVVTDKINMTILDGICAQISVAISNIRSNEEIVNKEREKSYLLEFSHDVAAVRTKSDLAAAVQKAAKKLSSVKGYVIRLINDDGITMSPYIFDSTIPFRYDPEFLQIIATKLKIKDGFHDKVLASDEPLLFDIEEAVKKGNAPQYVHFWKRVEFLQMTGTALRTGDTDLGVLWMETDVINIPLLKGFCAQVSVAISNIKSNEEIAQREEEKSILLSLSNEIAALKSREDLLHIVNTRIKALFGVKEFGLAQINEDVITYSAFIMDVGDELKDKANFEEVTSARYNVVDPLFSSIMESDDPVILDVNTLSKKAGMPAYVNFWLEAGLGRILAMKMHVGGKNIGCAFLHIDENSSGQIKTNMLKATCAHLSVAVSNILANEQIHRKHTEQTFLLDFSNDIALVRTKPELQAAISKVLDKTMHVQFSMIYVIDDDGVSMTPFMYDSTLFQQEKKLFEEQLAKKVTIKDPYISEVFASNDGALFNVAEESKSGNPLGRLWKTTGFRNMYIFPLRVGNKNIGTIGLLANKLNKELIKGICAQISVSIANIQANEKLLAYKKQLEVENDYLKEQIKTIYNFSDIIGSGPEMQKVYHMMSLVAESNSTVLLLGETGTGKELIARAIHNASPRKSKLMVKVNCAALPANLIESELFGHEKGSFTGATDRRIGKFELANHSTLFLDEIGEMPLETQVKLLRVIQERELERVGGSSTIKVDVRIITATNRNLEEEVKAGRFRSDLFYRLNVFPITLPPLRNRLEDIAPLSNFFLARYCKITGKKITSISANVIKELKGYMWPGNVRELEHLIERSVLFTQDAVLKEIQLPTTNKGAKTDLPELSHKTLQDIERSYIIEILKKYNGKIAGSDGAAHFLEIPSTTLHSKMKKLGISKSDYYLKKG